MLLCVCVCFSVCVCQLLISTSRRLLFEGDEGQVHRGMKEIKAHRQEQEVKLPSNSFNTTQGTHAILTPPLLFGFLSELILASYSFVNQIIKIEEEDLY